MNHLTDNAVDNQCYATGSSLETGTRTSNRGIGDGLPLLLGTALLGRLPTSSSHCRRVLRLLLLLLPLCSEGDRTSFCLASSKGH